MPIAMTTSRRRMIVSRQASVQTGADIPARQATGTQGDSGRPVRGDAATLVDRQDRERHYPGGRGEEGRDERGRRAPPAQAADRQRSRWVPGSIRRQCRRYRRDRPATAAISPITTRGSRARRVELAGVARISARKPPSGLSTTPQQSRNHRAGQSTGFQRGPERLARMINTESGGAGPRIPQASALCDHESVPRGTASRWKTRYSVRLTVPRCGGWRAWGIVRADFENTLADPRPTWPLLRLRSRYEHRRDADYVRVTLALAAADDVANALAIAWDVFRAAAEDDLTTWEVTSASAQVQPEPSLTGTGDSERENWPTRAGASSASERVPAL